MQFTSTTKWSLILAAAFSIGHQSYANDVSASQWYSAVRLEAGLVLDPRMPLAQCDSDAMAVIAQNRATQRATADEQDSWTLHALTSTKSSTNSFALDALRQTSMWVVEENGSRPVRLAKIAGAHVKSGGPCLHLTNFDISRTQRFKLKDDADVLISTTELSAKTRLVRAKATTQNAFFNEQYSPSLERPLAAWLVEKSGLLPTLLKDLPKPQDGVDRELCVPSHQPFNATLDGALRPLISLRVQWCECAQRVAGVCQKFNDPRGRTAQWLSVIDRRSGQNWLSFVSPPSGLQHLSVIALATGGHLKDDVIWFLEEFPNGVMSSISVRENRQLHRKHISSYSGF